MAPKSKLLLVFWVLLAALTQSARAAASNEHLSLCFIPGAGGGEHYTLEIVPREVSERGVPMSAFAVGFGGTVQTLAARFIELLEKKLATDPNFKCHMVGYSMGGLTMRYAASHLKVQHPTLGLIPVSNLMKTMTSISTPHRGTPLSRILKTYFGVVDVGVDQLSEENVKPFNDPGSESYSPAVEGIPFYSYLSHIDAPSESVSFLEQLGFNGILQDYTRRGIADTRNDGIVPTASQNFGQVVADIHVPHLYFGSKVKSEPSLPDFYELHWKFLNGQLSDQTKRNESRLIRFLSTMPQVAPN